METKIGEAACVVCGSAAFRFLFAHKGGSMKQCRTCELVQLMPMPTSREIAKLYHEDFDHFAPYLEQLDVHRAYFRKKIEDIRLRVSGDGLRVLDIGCAMGVLLEEAAKQGMEATGVDISKDAVTYCRKQNLKAVAGTIQTLGGTLPDASFDIITAFQIVEHERDPLGFMKRIHKLLKKDGMVVLATPNYGGRWRKVMGKRWVGFTHPEHVILLNFVSMRHLLEMAGFRDIQIRKDTPRPFPLSFAFKRAADYFPWAGWFFRGFGRLVEQFDIINPVNPWDDMVVTARK